MAESGDAALPQAVVVAASQPGNSTALVARPPKLSKEQRAALVNGAPEMFKWTSARVVKLMEFLVKDDEELFYMHFTSFAARDARRATQMAKLIGERRKKQNSDLLGMMVRAFGDFACNGK